MGGGKRKSISNKKTNNNNKPKFRRQPKQNQNQASLFIEGGILAGFDSPLTPSSSSSSRPGKHYKARSGNGGNGSGSNPTKRKCGAAASIPFRYDYPPLHPQGVMESEPCTEERNVDGGLTGSRPVILLGSRDNNIVAYEDQTPLTDASEVKYSYEYSSGFVLGESSQSGLGFSDEPDANPGVSELSSGMIDEEEQLHRGLGFSAQSETGAGVVVLSSTITQEGEESSDGSSSQEAEEYDDEGPMDEDDPESLPDKTPSAEKNSAFLSFGGLKLYTQDISDGESSDGVDEEDGEEDHSDEGSTSESSDSDDSEDSDDFDSDIDDGIVEDYLDGIGGSSQILKSKWLAGQNIDSQQIGDDSDDDYSSDGFEDTLQKLSGIGLQEASRQYGVQKQQSKKKPVACSSKSNAVSVAWPSSLDDLMLVKDPRRLAAKKKHVSQIPESWPSGSRKSKKHGWFPGEKKKQRKEHIALKRRERMLGRGVDLELINLKLKQMVLNQADILAFQPMHSRDCSQVQRLAAIYRLKSGCQGAGKKRFVTVTRTQHTSMPSASDEVRLEKLIGASKDDADFPVVSTPRKGGTGSAQSKPAKSPANRLGSSSRSERRSSGKKAAVYADQPVSFVSSGAMGSESNQVSAVESKQTSNEENKTIECTSSKYTSFEVHTKGFGSKMMAKMGFVEGAGLGKDGKGMSQPIEVVQRPKALGLGMTFDESCSEPVHMARVEPRQAAKRSGGSARNSASKTAGRNSASKTAGRNSASKTGGRHSASKTAARNSAVNIGAFEKHTKGFGSKMMAQMGFIEGNGLGRDSQGIVNPLMAVRRPRARGLGAEDKRL